MHKGFYALIVFSAGACYGVLSTFVKMAYAAGLTLTDVSGMQCLFGMLFLWLAALFTVKRRPSPFRILSLAAIGIPMALTTISTIIPWKLYPPPWLWSFSFSPYGWGRQRNP